MHIVLQILGSSYRTILSVIDISVDAAARHCQQCGSLKVKRSFHLTELKYEKIPTSSIFFKSIFLMDSVSVFRERACSRSVSRMRFQGWNVSGVASVSTSASASPSVTIYWSIDGINILAPLENKTWKQSFIYFWNSILKSKRTICMKKLSLLLSVRPS